MLARNGIGEGHSDSMFGPENDHGAGFDGLAWRQFEIIFPEQNAQNHEDLHHCVVAADAAPRAGAKGQIGEGWLQFFIRFGETLGVKALWILPVLWRVMRTVNENNDRRSAGYSDIADAVVGNCHAVDHPKRRVEAQRFLNDLRGKLESRNVARGQRRIAEDGIEFLAHLFETIGTRA